MRKTKFFAVAKSELTKNFVFRAPKSENFERFCKHLKSIKIELLKIVKIIKNNKIMFIF